MSEMPEQWRDTLAAGETSFILCLSRSRNSALAGCGPVLTSDATKAGLTAPREAEQAASGFSTENPTAERHEGLEVRLDTDMDRSVAKRQDC